MTSWACPHRPGKGIAHRSHGGPRTPTDVVFTGSVFGDECQRCAANAGGPRPAAALRCVSRNRNGIFQASLVIIRQAPRIVQPASQAMMTQTAWVADSGSDCT